MTMVGSGGRQDLSCSSTCRPPRPGMCKSRMTQSGRVDLMESRKACPDAKHSATRPDARNRRPRALRMGSSSSTTATRSSVMMTYFNSTASLLELDHSPIRAQCMITSDSPDALLMDHAHRQAFGVLHRDDVARLDLIECLDRLVNLQIERSVLWSADGHHAVVAIDLFNHCIDFPGTDDRAAWGGALRSKAHALTVAGSSGAGAFAQCQHDRLKIYHLETRTWLHLVEVLRFGRHSERRDAPFWPHDGDHARVPVHIHNRDDGFDRSCDDHAGLFLGMDGGKNEEGRCEKSRCECGCGFHINSPFELLKQIGARPCT